MSKEDEGLCLAGLSQNVERLLDECEQVIKNGQVKDDALFLLLMNTTIAMKNMHQMMHMLGAGVNAALVELEQDLALVKLGGEGATVQ